MIKISKLDLSFIIDLAHREVVDNASPRGLDAKEFQAYLFARAIEEFLKCKGIKAFTVDRDEFLHPYTAYDVYNGGSNDPCDDGGDCGSCGGGCGGKP